MLPLLPGLDIISMDVPVLSAWSVAVEGGVYSPYLHSPAPPLFLQNQNTMSSSTVPVGVQKVPTRDEWTSHRAEITRLYRDEKRTLSEVMRFMSERYDFRATTKMYKTRVSDWDIRRNLRKHEREDACRDLQQRWLSGEKPSKVVIRGQEKDVEVCLRHMRNANRGNQNERLAPRAQTWRMQRGNVNPPSPLCPASDERRLEIICMQTIYLCQASSNDLIGYCDDLYGNMWHAVKRAREHRYREARMLLNRAGQRLQDQIRHEADAVLLYLIRSLSLRSKGKIKNFDPLELLHKHALALSEIVHGSSHPLTIVLSQLLAVQNWAVVTSSAVQPGLEVIQAKGNFHGSLQVTHWLRHVFANMLEASGNHERAGQLRVEVLESKLTHRYTSYQINAIFSLARHYLEFEPHKHEEAARLFESIQHLTFDLGTKFADYATHTSFQSLAKLAETKGDLRKAEQYFCACADSAARCWGEGNSDSVEALENFARVLDLQGWHEEAERLWDQSEIRDDEDALSLNPLP